MIVIITPEEKRAHDWCAQQDPPFDPRKQRIISTSAPYKGSHGRLTPEDTVVWISGWSEGKYAVEVAYSLVPVINQGKPKEIHA